MLTSGTLENKDSGKFFQSRMTTFFFSHSEANYYDAKNADDLLAALFKINKNYEITM